MIDEVELARLLELIFPRSTDKDRVIFKDISDVSEPQLCTYRVIVNDNTPEMKCYERSIGRNELQRLGAGATQEMANRIREAIAAS